jgi:glycosyltransferase involved in cell wall biosynthesis
MDGIIAISQTVADEAMEWLDRMGIGERRIPLSVSFFHLGADTENSVPSRGVPAGADAILASMKKIRTFLMVGTLEPRKGHALVLDAMERLWADGEPIQLIIVGQQGWALDILAEKLRSHPERGRKLHWLEGVSDEYLDALYRNTTALIFASEGEGFGLPLIEAARYGAAIIARDIPVFREIAKDHADYFSADSDGAALATHLRAWMLRHAEGRHPQSGGVKWLTWRESALQLQEALDGRRHYRRWLPQEMTSASKTLPCSDTSENPIAAGSH